MSDFTIMEFFQRFPDNEACLDHLMAVRHGMSGACPKCQKATTWHRVRSIPAYACQWCGHHVHPMVGTPFEKSRTSLRKWFYAMYLFTTSRHGVPAKELQRQLGVTYKCAWRMGHELRKYMADVDGDPGLDGHVEVDETIVGGRVRGVKNRGRAMVKGKSTVFGMVERGGDVITRVVPDARKATLDPIITENVQQGSTISSDEWADYKQLNKAGYNHGTCNHGNEEWVNGIHHTNSIEGFWSRLKNSIKGTHIHVSPKHLSKYLGEFEYRYNMRKQPKRMFDRLLQEF